MLLNVKISLNIYQSIINLFFNQKCKKKNKKKSDQKVVIGKF